MGRQMADQTALGGARVLPERLLAAGYEFRHRTLEPALRHVLGREHDA
jgi:NAD dependent epimerase/dehydratase family enzyme